MKKKYCYIIFILLSFSCRTMFINQTADTLKPKEHESNFNISTGISFNNIIRNYYSFYGPTTNISFGCFQRFGIRENLELQININTQAYMFHIYNYTNYPQLGVENYIDFSPKFQIYAANSHHLALNPFFGINLGWLPLYDPYNVILGPDIGLNFIGSYDLKKNDNISFYYGFSFEIKNDLMALTKNIMTKYYFNGFPLMDFDIGVSFGWEIRKKYIVRHEINLSAFFSTDLFYQNFNTTLLKTELSNYTISLSYNFSIGKIYQMK